MLCSFYPAQTNKQTNRPCAVSHGESATREARETMEIHDEMVAHLSNPDRVEGESSMALLVVQERPSQEAIDAAVAEVDATVAEVAAATE